MWDYETCAECGTAVENSVYGSSLHLKWHETLKTLMDTAALREALTNAVQDLRECAGVLEAYGQDTTPLATDIEQFQSVLRKGSNDHDDHG